MYHSSLDQSLIPHRLNNHQIFERSLSPQNERVQLLKNLIMKIPMTTLTKTVMYFEISNRIISLDVIYLYLYKHVLPIPKFSIFFVYSLLLKLVDSIRTHINSYAWTNITKNKNYPNKEGA